MPLGVPHSPEHREAIRLAMQAYTKPIKHGTWNAYNNRKCRCPKCRAAAATYQRERKAEKKMKKKNRSRRSD